MCGAAQVFLWLCVRVCVCACECGTLELPLLCPAPPHPESRPYQGFQEQERGERKGGSPLPLTGICCTRVYTHSHTPTTLPEIHHTGRGSPQRHPRRTLAETRSPHPQNPLHLLLVLSAGRSPPPPSRSLPGGVGGRVRWASQRWVVCVPGELGGVVRGESGP